MFSEGKICLIAFATVNPPTPESKIPIGLVSLIRNKITNALVVGFIYLADT